MDETIPALPGRVSTYFCICIWGKLCFL